jgi:PadR family transcriptional regulator, regulatory protein PadR
MSIIKMTPSPAILGEIEQLVLLAVLKLDGSAYAVPIRDLIRREARVALARGSIYVTLDRLEKKGFVASAFSEPVHARGGKARRMFAIRSAGLAALRHSRRALDRLSAGTALAKP